jgi:hypothetical protein
LLRIAEFLFEIWTLYDGKYKAEFVVITQKLNLWSSLSEGFQG